jgi:nitrite reductase (NADH) small subunit/3-phenylpropionate/trans-cinnamate dioxygenase ferredoxin subunit
MARNRTEFQREGTRLTVYQTVCRVSDIAEGMGHTVYAGDKAIALFCVGGKYFAIDDTCPHMGASLGSGFVEGGTVTCPWHFWRFRLSDGTWADNPKLGIGCYAVRVVGEDVQVDIPESPAEAAS